RRKMQMVFQDPYASLDPRMRVGEIIAEGMRIHRLAAGRELKARVTELLTRVGLRAEYYDRYPHEFSGGQRQRIGIARALAVNAKFIAAGEAVAALDVPTPAQILNLLLARQRELALPFLSTPHARRGVEPVSARGGVIYPGKTVETPPAAKLNSAG